MDKTPDQEEQEIWDRFACAALTGKASRGIDQDSIIVSAVSIADKMIEIRKERIERIDKERRQNLFQLHKERTQQEPSISNGK